MSIFKCEYFGGIGVRALAGKIEGKGGRGRTRMLWMTSLNAWIAERGIRHQEGELIEKARNRELWHAMIAHVRIRHLERERKRGEEGGGGG